MDAYERHLMLEQERLHEFHLPRECVECGDPADDRELCDACAVKEVTTCRCGAPATGGCVDLLEDLCWACWQDFDAWANTNSAALGNTLVFADWPGRQKVAA